MNLELNDLRPQKIKKRLCQSQDCINIIMYSDSNTAP